MQSEPGSPESASDEEAARAQAYGLLARLFYAPASADLLQALRLVSVDGPASDAMLVPAWRALVQASRALADAQIAAEYDALFGGVGRPEVSLLASQYLSGLPNDRALVRLRGDLAALGLERDEAMPEPEDHLAYLCEVMRHLIAGHPASPDLNRQRAFFAAHLQPWVGHLCDAIQAHPKACFHSAAAGYLRAFVELETQAFAMLA